MNNEDHYEHGFSNGFASGLDSGVDQGLELAAQVVDTACSVDESLRKLSQAIRDLKSD